MTLLHKTKFDRLRFFSGTLSWPNLEKKIFDIHLIASTCNKNSMPWSSLFLRFSQRTNEEFYITLLASSSSLSKSGKR